MITICQSCENYLPPRWFSGCRLRPDRCTEQCSVCDQFVPKETGPHHNGPEPYAEFWAIVAKFGVRGCDLSQMLANRLYATRDEARAALDEAALSEYEHDYVWRILPVSVALRKPGR